MSNTKTMLPEMNIEMALDVVSKIERELHSLLDPQTIKNFKETRREIIQLNIALDTIKQRTKNCDDADLIENQVDIVKQKINGFIYLTSKTEAKPEDILQIKLLKNEACQIADEITRPKRAGSLDNDQWLDDYSPSTNRKREK